MIPPTTDDVMGSVINEFVELRVIPDHQSLIATFAGEKSQAKDETLFMKAEAMEKTGTRNSDIRKATGWFRNADDKQWRYEIDDSKMKFDRDVLRKLKQGGEVKLGELISHDKLFEAYPQLKEMPVSPATDDRDGGLYVPDEKRIELSNKTNYRQKEVNITHEIQHAVQDIEGVLNSFGRPDGTTDSMKKYLRNQSEKESRDSGSRLKMDEKTRKARSPWTQGTNLNLQ